MQRGVEEFAFVCKDSGAVAVVGERGPITANFFLKMMAYFMVDL